MDTSVHQVTPVDYTFDIKASAEDLDGDINKEMRRHRSGLTLKGFRPGKVPLSIVKKMYGKAIAFEIVEKTIQSKFEEDVLRKDEYDVLGGPQMETLEYEPFGDLHAVINFGTKPSFEIKDLSGEEVVRVTHEVDDKEIDEEIETHRKQHATTETHDGPTSEDDVVKCTIQQLDLSTETPVVGERQEDVPVALGNADTLPELKKALVGLNVGDVTKVTLPPPEGEKVDSDPRKYELTVTEVTRQILPELDEAFFEHASQGKEKTLEGLKSWIRKHLEERWTNAIREDLHGNIVKAVTDVHDFEIPKAAIDAYLDNYISELKRQDTSGNPETFDTEEFRESQKEQAEGTIRWQLIREKVIADEKLSVSKEDVDAHFEEMGKARDVSGDVMRKIMEAYNPGSIGQVESQLLDRKIFDYLGGLFTVVEKPFEEVYGDEEADS